MRERCASEPTLTPTLSRSAGEGATRFMRRGSRAARWSNRHDAERLARHAVARAHAAARRRDARLRLDPRAVLRCCAVGGDRRHRVRAAQPLDAAATARAPQLGRARSARRHHRAGDPAAVRAGGFAGARGHAPGAAHPVGRVQRRARVRKRRRGAAAPCRRVARPLRSRRPGRRAAPARRERGPRQPVPRHAGARRRPEHADLPRRAGGDALPRVLLPARRPVCSRAG